MQDPKNLGRERERERERGAKKKGFRPAGSADQGPNNVSVEGLVGGIDYFYNLFLKYKKIQGFFNNFNQEQKRNIILVNDQSNIH